MLDELLVAPGTLLAAWPDLRDPNFMHSVVVMCQHSPEGAYGLVSNRPTDLTVADLLPDHPVLGQLAFPIHLGGPVDHASMQFLHRVPELIPGGIELDGKLWLGGELDVLASYLHEEGDKALGNVRIFLGYSGWGGGQLEVELQGGSWLPAPVDLGIIFDSAGEEAWRRVVRSVSPEGVDLENQPPDVNWN